MKKIILMAFVAMMAAVSVRAQIPADVKLVLDKCGEKMDNPSGLVMDITLKMKMVIFSGNGTMKWYMKGDKSFCVMNVRAMGQEMREESGFDGQQEWEFTAAMSKKERDSLIITKTSVARKNEYGMDIDYAKSYKKAKMQEKGLFYVIELSDRIDPDLPKKMTLKIAKDSYYLREISTSVGPAKVTLTITKVTVGCNDNCFRLDMNRYKNAVVVRK